MDDGDRQFCQLEYVYRIITASIACQLVSFDLSEETCLCSTEIIAIADTWGSHSKTIRKSSYGSAPSSGKSTPLPQPAEPSSSSSSGKGGRKASGTRSGSTSRSNSRSNSAERRRSGGGADDTASPTRKPALFDAFRPRSKSDAGKRKPSIIANMKSAVQVR